MGDLFDRMFVALASTAFGKVLSWVWNRGRTLDERFSQLRKVFDDVHQDWESFRFTIEARTGYGGHMTLAKAERVVAALDEVARFVHLHPEFKDSARTALMEKALHPFSHYRNVARKKGASKDPLARYPHATRLMAEWYPEAQQG
mgnify:CR=1 FL=1